MTFLVCVCFSVCVFIPCEHWATVCVPLCCPITSNASAFIYTCSIFVVQSSLMRLLFFSPEHSLSLSFPSLAYVSAVYLATRGLSSLKRTLEFQHKTHHEILSCSLFFKHMEWQKPAHHTEAIKCHTSARVQVKVIKVFDARGGWQGR